MTFFLNLCALHHRVRCQLPTNLQRSVTCRHVCKCDHPASSQVKIGALFILLGPVILTKKQQRKSRSRGREWSSEERQQRHGRNYSQLALTCVTPLHPHTTHMPQISTTYLAWLQTGSCATLTGQTSKLSLYTVHLAVFWCVSVF